MERTVGSKGDDETGLAAKIIGSRFRARCSLFFFFFYVYRVTDCRLDVKTAQNKTGKKKNKNCEK